MHTRTGSLIIALTLLCTSIVAAQGRGIEIVPLCEYMWTTGENAYSPDYGNGTFDIKSNPMFGLSLYIDAVYGMQAELTYMRQESKVTFRTSQGREDICNLATSFYHIGLNRALRTGRFVPYTGFSLGMTEFNPDLSGADTEYKFSMSVSLGGKFFFNDRLGLRLQGRFITSLLNASGGIFIGPGGSGVSFGGSGIAQWTLGGGLVFRL